MQYGLGFRTSLVLLLIAASCGLPVGAHAKRIFTFPVEVGGVLAEYSREYNPPDIDYPLIAGARIGGGVRASLGDLLAVQCVVTWQRKGAKTRGTVPTRDGQGNDLDPMLVTAWDHLDYLCVPVSLQAYLSNGKVTPYLRAGGELGFLLSGKSRLVIAYDGQREVEERNLRKSLHGTDVGVLAGAGVAWDRSLPVYLELGYVHGLVDIHKGYREQRNRGWTGVVGVRF